jgi:hypothetical protein
MAYVQVRTQKFSEGGGPNFLGGPTTAKMFFTLRENCLPVHSRDFFDWGGSWPPLRYVLAYVRNKIIQNVKTSNCTRHKTNTYFNNLHQMSNKIIPSLLTLPVELVYRILDKMDDWTMLCSMRNVCTQINITVDTYHRYQVNISVDFHHFQNSPIYIVSLQ